MGHCAVVFVHGGSNVAFVVIFVWRMACGDTIGKYREGVGVVLFRNYYDGDGRCEGKGLTEKSDNHLGCRIHCNNLQIANTVVHD